ncbi:MAG: phosphate acyltransferase PlsX [Clostridiales bacterium]|nr:phosphate acyltransferase PlsX [Clostridiales bacterium]
MKILVDAFGGDNSPKEIIAGSISALEENKEFELVLVGKKEIIEEELKGYSFDSERVSILNAEEVITCEEEPTVAIRRKPNSSISVAFKELKENSEAGAFVSAGSTGAVLVGATLKLGRIKGVNRPALCPLLPTIVDGKQVLLLDSGANADCKPINMVQFALMGSAYAESLGVKNPKIALLSNGTEDEKGNALNHEVFPVLKSLKSINFVGNCEARDILSGEYDVIVADGFSGNVALKSMEGAIGVVLKSIKQGVYGSIKGKIGGLFLKKTFSSLKDKLDYNNKGGALFLGVNKPVIKAHGSSKRLAIKNTVLQAVEYAKFNISEKITEKLNQEEIKIGE